MIRSVTPADHDKVAALLDEAFFPSCDESFLVARLRAHGKSIWEWIVEDERGLVGYVCYSNAFRDREVIGYHLAPVAVRTDAQKKGIGSSLILESLAKVGDGYAPVFVLGFPKYYSRFGFTHIDSPICPFDPTNEHFMALRWKEGSTFTIGYEEEFKGARFRSATAASTLESYLARYLPVGDREFDQEWAIGALHAIDPIRANTVSLDTAVWQPLCPERGVSDFTVLMRRAEEDWSAP